MKTIHKKILTSLGVLIVLFLVGNPNQEKFEKTAKEHAKSYSANATSGVDLPTYFQNILETSVDRIIDIAVTTDNYYLFSIAKRQYSNVDGTTVIGVGVLWLYYDVSNKSFNKLNN
jgi:hypothetical protein